MAHLTDGDIDLIVPGPASKTLEPGMTRAEIVAYAKTVTQKPVSLRTPFEQYAASVLAEIQKMKRRLHSQHLWQDEDAFEAVGQFELSDLPQKVRMIGEVWAYGEINLVNSGDSIDLPPNGDIERRTLAKLTNDDLAPISLSRLVSARGSVMTMGHIDSTGNVYLDAMTTGTRIASGDAISLVGMWPLHHWYDSQA